MLKFLVVLFFAAAVVTTASIAWERFTTSPKPQSLNVIEGMVGDTQAGQTIAQVFGVFDEQPIEPINVADAAKSLAGSFATTLTSRVEQSVANQAIVAVAKQYDQLPEDQQKILETIICQPAP